MSRSICLRCRATLRRDFRTQTRHSTPTARAYSSPRPHSDPLDVKALLSKPTWSVRSLLSSASSPATEEITPATLHHLLRLSALPQPSSPEEEASMLRTLHSQLHFVRDMQSVDTEGVEPLQSLRDETEEGIREATIGVEDVRAALEQEEFRGRNKRPRRKKAPAVTIREEGTEGWDVLGTAGETVEVGGARYFVVRSGEGEKDVLKDDVVENDTLKD